MRSSIGKVVSLHRHLRLELWYAAGVQQHRGQCERQGRACNDTTNRSLHSASHSPTCSFTHLLVFSPFHPLTISPSNLLTPSVTHPLQIWHACVTDDDFLHAAWLLPTDDGIDFDTWYASRFPATTPGSTLKQA